MSSPLKNNLVGLLLAPTKEFEAIKLGHVIALAEAEGIDMKEEKEKYKELERLRTLGRSALRGSPEWLSQAASLQADILFSVLKKIFDEKPSILREASEKVSEYNLAELVRGMENARRS